MMPPFKCLILFIVYCLSLAAILPVIKLSRSEVLPRIAWLKVVVGASAEVSWFLPGHRAPIPGSTAVDLRAQSIGGKNIGPGRHLSVFIIVCLAGFVFSSGGWVVLATRSVTTVILSLETVNRKFLKKTDCVKTLQRSFLKVSIQKFVQM